MVDTSVLCELLQVPGKSSAGRGEEVKAEVVRRWQAGERFLIPITAVIETGNHIAQSDGDRYSVASRLVRLLRNAVAGEGNWLVYQTELGAEFLTSLCQGDSTGMSLEEQAATKVGAGDIAILVERDQFVSATVYREVDIWTFDLALQTLASIRP